jgi:hypothetical protein
MQTLDGNDREQIAESPPFRDVYRFILGAARGDAAAAKATFERYLAGELSEELLTISRQCVEADRADRQIKTAREAGGSDAFSGVS